MSDHLVACPACRAALPMPAGAADPAGGSVELPALAPDAPPDYEELAALLDGTLDAAQSAGVRGRLAASPEAGAAFARLEGFRDAIATLPPKWHGPARATESAGPASPEDLPAPGKCVPFPRWRRVSWAAVAAAALLMTVLWLAGGTHRTPPPWDRVDLAYVPDGLRGDVARAARTGTVELPPIPPALRPPRETLAGAAAPQIAWRQIAPVGRIVREDRPVLRWSPRAEATSYVVYLADVDGREPLLREELTARETEWTPTVPLTRGTIYEWQVEARRGNDFLDRTPGPPLPEARFEVLDARWNATLTDLERHYPGNALVLGTAYARAGLRQASARQFEALAREQPSSAVAASLRRQTADAVVAGQ